MVRSRSETNLNRIFVDLCTSPDVRSKQQHQRQYHPALPTLKPIKSNSCSNIDEITQNVNESSSYDSKPTDISPISTPQPTALHVKTSKSTAIPLVPIESTGFIVEPTLSSIHNSLSLFETLSINHTKHYSSLVATSPQPTTYQPASLTSTPSNSSEGWKQQDFTNRLRNRLKSRGHLRKFFLS